MNVKRFVGKNSKLALAQVKEALGEDAVILSNRAVDGGNEILALSESDLFSATSYQEPERPLDTRIIEDAQSSTLEALFRKRMQAEDVRQSQLATSYAPQEAAPTVNASQHQIDAANAQIATMMREIRNMRSVIESQLAEIAWGATQNRDPMKSRVLSLLLSTGFSAELSKQLVERLPAKQNESQAMTWLYSVLGNNFATVGKDDELLDRGGIFAIVGPTGVGKTTTTAKLAARYVMRHGTEKIGLITTDSYRIGGHEQLRTYGKILGVMVHSVKDEAELKIALNELKHKHIVLIDTVGVSQRDQMVTEQLAMLSANHLRIRKLLCLNATNTGETLIDVVRAYQGRGLDGCIMTKMDEAITLGNVIDIMIRAKLKLHYVANGQRVPEDLHVPHKQQLLHRAFKLGLSRNSPFQYQKEDLALVMGNATRSIKNAELAHA